MRRHVPIRIHLAAASFAVTLAGCASPPEPPKVDDSNKRPVNVSHHVEVQQCRAELSAAKIVLTEALAQPERAAVNSTPATAQPAAVIPNKVLVINFPIGSSEIAVQPDYERLIVDQAKAAKFIVIRGRTDSLADNAAETKLAMRRAKSAYAYLVRASRQLPPEGVRITWQGAGDRAAQGTSDADKLANRRVEIEFYRARPEVEVIASQAS